jgi:DNA-binding LytR/AlgR family response regulator
MIKYIIVDDEPLAHEIIEGFCNILPHLQLEKHCYDALEAMQFLNNNSIDIMFLDLNMPKLKGFDFLRTLSNPPKVIVTTAHKEFALDGYELNISDYLLKPFSFERLLKAVNKAIGANNQKPSSPTPTTQSENTRFFVKGDKKYHQINSEEILFIEAYGNYTKVFLKEEMIVSHENISYYESLLHSVNFLRVHKSFIIALEKIKLIEGNRIFIYDHQIPIGQTYKSKVNKLYNS